MPSPQKIILTRPIDQARPLATRLMDSGYSVEHFPLLEIASLPERGELQTKLQSAIASLPRYALAVFVSPNAIHTVFQHGLVWPSDVAIAVMGEGSRAALAQYGINKNTRVYCPADPLHFDSEALLRTLDLPALENRAVIIFRAEKGREFLPDALAARNIRVDKVACYRRFAPLVTEKNNHTLEELVATRNDWVVSSSEAIRTLDERITKAIGEVGVVKSQHINLLVSHRRIAETAEKCGFKCIRVIASGDENLLLALQSHL